MAKNLRLVTNTEENSGELRLIEGAEYITKINQLYGQSTILAATQIRDYGILIVKNSQQPVGILPEYVSPEPSDDNSQQVVEQRTYKFYPSV